MTSVVDAVCERIRTCSSNDDSVNTSLDRLAQTILVALHTECLSGSLSECIEEYMESGGVWMLFYDFNNLIVSFFLISSK